MTEIYWILTLSKLGILGIILTVLAGTIILILSILLMIEDEEDIFKQLKGYIFTAIIGILLIIFVPNKQEMLTIYGIGGTIEYVKNNETAKELPNKCVEALDLWVDNYLNKEE